MTAVQVVPVVRTVPPSGDFMLVADSIDGGELWLHIRRADGGCDCTHLDVYPLPVPGRDFGVIFTQAAP